MLKKWKMSLCSLGISVVLGVSAVASEPTPAQPILQLPTGDIINESLRPRGDKFGILPYVTDQILVRFKVGVEHHTIASAHVEAKAIPLKKFRVVENLHLVRLPRTIPVGKAIELYRRNPDVLYAEPNYIVRAFNAPNDLFFSSLWNLQNTGQEGGTPGADIDAPMAWEITTGSNSVVIAVIDTGIDYNHQDLSANIWRNTADCDQNGMDDDGNGYLDDCYGIDTVNNDSDPVDDHDHGTHVAGTIGAIGNNSIGVVGVNWNVSVMACKFLDANGYGDIAGAIECFEYVQVMRDRGANIVATNNSWGSGYFSQALFEAIDAHRQRNILCIAAAGNDNANNDIVSSFPANYYLPNMISVAATDRFDKLPFSSNYGKRSVHVGAPGSEILSTTIENTYTEFSGTSMATPHVAGVAALLKAQNPTRDWKAIKNLILSGGDTISSLAEKTITQKRLNAYGTLTCSNSVILSRLLPISNTVNGAVGELIDLSVLHIKCETPNGEVNVIVNPGSQVVTLGDDGLGGDQEADDGIYSGQWTPSSGGTFTLTFPGGDVVTVVVDPDLEPGFPVKAYHSAGSYHGGPAIHTLIGNIDDDPELEIVVTGLAGGPLFAWHFDGTPVTGWPSDIFAAGYPAMGNLSNASNGFEIFSGYWDGSLVAYSGAGNVLTGWPRDSANYISSPPALADVDGDGLDEIFIAEEDWKLHAYKADGSPLPGWPAYQSVGGQERHTPAIADLDGDGDLEIVTTSGRTTLGVYLLAYHHDGTSLTGFPFNFDGYTDIYPVIGDVDGDGAFEIIFAARVSGNPGVLILSADGKIKRSMGATGQISYGAAPALADLDGDSIPEIIVQTNGTLNVWRGDGSTLPGWPLVFTGGDYWVGNSSPVVGDVDGDGLPDIVITNQIVGSSELGEVRVYNRSGVLHSHFPKRLKMGSGAVPAIADIDLDGRNEIIVTGAYWNGYDGFYDKVWVYDLGGSQHGPIQWGQFGGGPKHQGYYPYLGTPDTTPPTPNPMTWAMPPYQTGTGAVSMAAATATDPTTPVSYYFDFVDSPTGGTGGTDSAWQSGTPYSNSGLQANHQYGFRVKARDGVNNETAYSTPTRYVYTAIEPPAGIGFGAVTSTSIQVKSTNTPSGLTRGSSGLVVENLTNGTNSGWKQNNDFWMSSPLTPNTSHSFRAKARNGDAVETGYCPSISTYTLANPPGAASFSNVTQTCIRANWTANGNPSGTQYLGENTTTGANSGWISNTYWDSCGLVCGTAYSFRVKAKNAEGIETSWTNLGSRTTQACDTTPPTPNPMTWLAPPYQIGTNSISMVATTAADPTPPISYYFDFVMSPTGWSGGADSGWQSGTSYTNSNLRVNHKYGYRVKAKDGVNNETAYSTTQYAYSAIEVPIGITIRVVTSSSIQVQSTNTSSGLTRGSSGLLIENITNVTNSGWKRDNTPWTSKPLLPNTSYSFRAKARNGDGIETDYSTSASKYTLANLPGRSSFSNVTQTCIRANWTANGNPVGTQYFCQNITTKAESGWITETYWDSCNLSYGTTCSFRVKARNGEGIETGWTVLGTKSTLGCVIVLTPNGGEVIPSGSTYNIQWETCSDAVSFNLFYSLDSGTNWTLIEKGVTERNYPWPVPKPTSNKKGCLIKVVGYNASGKVVGSDRSDKPFTIEVVKVVSPNGGEILKSGNPYEVKWKINGTKSPVATVKLYYSADGGSNWSLITTLVGSQTSYDCTPTVKATKTKCKVMVALKDAKGNALGSDISDGYFTIEP